MEPQQQANDDQVALQENDDQVALDALDARLRASRYCRLILMISDAALVLRGPDTLGGALPDYWLTGNGVEAVKKTLFEVIDQASRVYPEIWNLLDQFIE